MAREGTRLARALEGVFWIGGLLTAVIAYCYYAGTRRHQPPDTHVICEKCGDALGVSDVLDPSVTCSCIPSQNHRDQGRR